MKVKIIVLALVLLPMFSIAQETLTGVISIEENGKKVGLEGATVYWENTSVGATTDEKGAFEIEYSSVYKSLIISFVGYETITLNIDSSTPIYRTLKESNELETVEISARKKTTAISYSATANVSRINSEELLKAACCNLSESFETNPSIDVNFSDAVTGTKQVQMLGLNSPYILIAQENIPSVRGASQAYGLTFTPGTWVESIQITKGAGSVVNGFESIAGQINAELVKPSKDDRFFVNLYGSTNGRLEVNTHMNTKVTDRWSTGIYIHGNEFSNAEDDNHDNFLDMPLGKQLNIMNRWEYQNLEKGWISFLNFRYLTDDKNAGELDYNSKTDKFTTNAWGSEIKTNRFDFSSKVGYVFPEIPYQSFGFQLAYSNHDQDAYYGLKIYDIQHQSVYSNLVFNSIIGDTRHKFKAGLTYTYDTYEEQVNTDFFKRNENSIGTFFEYAYDDLDKFSFTAGIRADYHNKLDFFVTPRLHLRYAPWEKGVLRASVGRGKKSANIFAENQQLFASNRTVNIRNEGGNVYGLNPEIAWNYGVSFLQGFNLFERKGDIVFDYYRTNFQDKVVIDWETPTEINFYNLNGKSEANSFQTEINYNIFEHVDLRLAYKYYDITSQHDSGALEKALIPKHRFFINVGAETHVNKNGNWKFDATYNWLGEQRFPNTSSNPIQYQKPEYSEAINLLNFQVTKVFSRKFEIYLGGENITSTTQDKPIVSSEDPFGAYFDSTMIFAPIHGSHFYAGLRYKL